MAWKVEVDKDAQRYLAKLDKPIARRIVAKLRQISELNDPRMQEGADWKPSRSLGVPELEIISLCASLKMM